MNLKPFQTTPRALLVSIRTPAVSDHEADESLFELERLVNTLGLNVVGKEWQRRPHTKGGTVVGEGKLKELAELTGGPGVIERNSFAKKNKAKLRREESDAAESGEGDAAEEDAIVGDDEAGEMRRQEFLGGDGQLGAAEKPVPLDESRRPNIVVLDCELTPSQTRNLEKALGCEVMDRTGVIIEIFSRHAKTRAARLQVEIARLNYLAPRLRETGGGSERQAGRGSGETEIELDRRNIRDRVTELRAELEQVNQEQANRRVQRSEQRCVALVGYTNAGKSSLMRALTGSAVLVQDKLFATLDTTVRALQPETKPRILVSDTVGFIKSLPHDLVASFRSTLDEAHNASLLLYVVDAADANFRAQLAVTREVLGEVGVSETPSLLVLNKSDRLNDEQKRELAREYPDAVQLSTRDPNDVRALSERLVAFFERGMVEEAILARYEVPGIVGELRASTRVVSERFENEGVRMTVRAPAAVLERIKKKFSL